MEIFAVVESSGSEGSGHWEIPVRYFVSRDDAEVFLTTIELHVLALDEADADWTQMLRLDEEFNKAHGLSAEHAIDRCSYYFIKVCEVY